MRKYCALIMCIVLAFTILIGCNNSRKKDEVSFFAVVLENNESYLLVEPEEGSSELNSADRMTVSIGDAALLDSHDKEIVVGDIKPGDKIHIFYNGLIAESYPAQINKCYKIIVSN